MVKFFDLAASLANLLAKEHKLAILAFDVLAEAAVLFPEVRQRAVSCELVLKHRAKDADHPAPSDGIAGQHQGRENRRIGYLGK